MFSPQKTSRLPTADPTRSLIRLKCESVHTAREGEYRKPFAWISLPICKLPTWKAESSSEARKVWMGDRLKGGCWAVSKSFSKCLLSTSSYRSHAVSAWPLCLPSSWSQSSMRGQSSQGRYEAGGMRIRAYAQASQFWLLDNLWDFQ